MNKILTTEEKRIIENLGPLKILLGNWKGTKGTDIAPAPDRSTENNPYREEMSFELLSQVDNHEQTLYGLRYRTTAWEEGKPDPFHEEIGYWLWDSKREEVMRCFLVPRGISLIAGGNAKAHANEFNLSAKLGSQTFGICSNPFLDQEFKTVQYDFKLKFIDENNFTYEQDTQIQMKDRKDIFHHTDQNNMKRVL